MDHVVTLDELKRLINQKGRFYLLEAQAPMMYEDTHLPGSKQEWAEAGLPFEGGGGQAA